MTRHPLLVRQLRRYFGDLSQVPASLEPFLNAIDEAYRQADDDRQTLERSMDLSSQELLQANSEMRAVVQAFPDIFFLLDREGTIRDCKGGSESDFVVPARLLIGKRVQDMPPREMGTKFSEALERLRAANQASVSVEYRLADQQRDAFYEGRLVRLPDDQVLMIVRNITERKSAEEALKQSEDHLRQSQKLEAIGRLAGGIAHDFNNLLTLIIGSNNLLAKALPAGSPESGRVEQIRHAANRAALLTNQLLAFSRKQVIQPRVLDLNDAVMQISKMLTRVIGEHIRLEVVLGARPGLVKADPVQMEQVMLNLAVNARDAMPHGGTLTIETGQAEVGEGDAGGAVPNLSKGSYVTLVVRDSGIGMDAATQAQCFEPFFTTKEVGRGTGLGLATVYGIAQQSGGTVAVASAVGRGTTFTVYLPRHLDGAAGTNVLELTVQPQTGTETVLLVEDDTDLRLFARELLEECGYTVLDAPDGTRALSLARRTRGPIHLLLTDVIMPVMSGRELAQRLSADRPDTKVLFMSGYTDDEIGHHGVLDPGIELIKKPFTIEELADRMRAILDRPSL